MKKTVFLVLKIVFIILIVAWMSLLITDYFSARDGKKPLICLSEETINSEKGSYYRCTSLGYKYYEFKEKDQVRYGFGAAFIKNDIEKEIGA